MGNRRSWSWSDIVVDNDPYKSYMGDDQQLDKAIELMKEQIKGKIILSRNLLCIR